MTIVRSSSTALVWPCMLLAALLQPKQCVCYEATWESLDSRPLPQWYDDSKFGIFIHWGVFSVPSFGGEWFWQKWGRDGNGGDNATKKFVKATELPKFAYADYAHRFDATMYQPEHWANVFAQSGAQYVVLTSKHHEGFCNWDSRSIPTTWDWNSMDVGPRRDLVGELAKEVKKASSSHTGNKLKFGLYHSLYEWFNPLYTHDKGSKFSQSHFVDLKTLPELYDIVKKYEPELIWSDGDWEAPSKYWKATEFLAWYATNSSVADTAVWNDRWGKDSLCKHGSFLTCADRFLPSKVMTKKWENALTITKGSWGYDRALTFSSYYTAAYLVHTLIQTVAFNGNMLLNVGPRADGTLDPIFEERLLEMGTWLSVNGDAIYGSKPWGVAQNETASNVFYTVKRSPTAKTLYALFTAWPDDNHLHLASPVATSNTKIRMLGVPNDKKELNYAVAPHSLNASTGDGNSQDGLTVELPSLNPASVPCQHAWVLAITGIGNFDPDQGTNLEQQR